MNRWTLIPLIAGLSGSFFSDRFLPWQKCASAAQAVSQTPGDSHTSELAIELKERADDASAVAYYEASLVQFERLANIKKSNNKDATVALKIRILETLNKIAAIQFRLAHAPQIDAARTAQNQKNYQNTLNRIVAQASEFLQKNPRAIEVARAIYLRSQAYQELDLDSRAIQDLKYFVDYFKQNKDLPNAQLSLYDLLIKAKDYRTALFYLERYQIKPSQSIYPIILDRFAFTYFYLNQIDPAIDYLRKELAFSSGTPNSPGSESALQKESANFDRTKILMNCALFYFTGIQNRLPNYKVEGVINFIKSLQPGPSFGKVLNYFGKLILSKGREEDLEIVKQKLDQDHLHPRDLIQFYLIVLTHEVAKGNYKSVESTAIRMSTWFEIPEILPQLRANLTEAASILQTRMIQQKNSPSELQIGSTLILLDNLLLKFADTATLQVKIHFNLGEIYYKLKNSQQAIFHYRWLVDHFTTNPQGSLAPADVALIERAKLNSVQTQYEILSAQGKLPKQLNPQAIPIQVPHKSEETQQWLHWIDQCTNARDAAVIETFTYEGIRLQYSQGQIPDALNQSLNQIRKYPQSNYTIALGSLVIDTYIASEKWDDVIKLSEELLASKKIQGKDLGQFNKRLTDVINKSYLKITEISFQKNDFAEVIKRVETHSQTKSTATKSEDIALESKLNSLAAHAALSLNDKKKALIYFSKINSLQMDSTTSNQFLLTQISVAEEEYNLDSAAGALNRYIIQNRSKVQPEMIKKVLLYAFLAKNKSLLVDFLKDHQLCSQLLTHDCDDLIPMSKWIGVPQPTLFTKLGNLPSPRATLELIHQGPLSSRALWALYGLETPEKFTYRQKQSLLKTFVEGWSQLDGVYQLTLLPTLSQTLTKAVRSITQNIHSASPISLQKEAIQKRVALIEEFEHSLEILSQLPLSQVRVEGFHEWANLYLEFSNDLASLPKPTDLSKEDLNTYDQTIASLRDPLLKKVEDFHQKSISLAAQSGIEAPNTPSSPTTPPLIQPDVMTQVHGPSPWEHAALESARVANWGQLHFLIQVAFTQKVLTEEQQTLARAGLFCLAGAQPECLLEFESNLAKFNSDFHRFALTTLIRGYYEIKNSDKVRKLFALALKKDDLDLKYQPELFQAIQWADMPDKQELKADLSVAAKAEDSPNKGDHR